MVLSRSRALSAVKSSRETILRALERSRRKDSVRDGGPSGCRDSIIAAPLFSAQHSDCAQHIDDILESKGLALALLPFDQIHRHFHKGLRATQGFDEHLRLKAVAARLNAQALEDGGHVNLQAVVVSQATP